VLLGDKQDGGKISKLSFAEDFCLNLAIIVPRLSMK
jgi:hypothetical protein